MERSDQSKDPPGRRAYQNESAGGSESLPAKLAPGTSRLTWYLLGAIVAAILLAFLRPDIASMTSLGGEIFLRLLKMIVVPLVMTSVMSGILRLGDVRRLGRAGGYTVLYYFATTLLAVLVGLLVVNVVQPGVGTISPERFTAAATGPAADAPSPESNLTPKNHQTQTLGQAFGKLARLLFTDNLFAAMAEGQLLPLIVFSIVFAAVLTTMGSRAEPVTRLILGVNDALMRFVMLLMKVAPIGVFCLVAAHFGSVIAEGKFLDELNSLGYYVLTVIAGLGVHFLVTLPLILFLFTRRNPYRFIVEMSEALLTAFSTASSSATLPISIDCAERRGRVSRRSVEFVLPLGATINMDGTALYEAVSAMFIAQAFGYSLGLLEQLTIFVTATLVAIGAAGIPQAGVVTMVIVLNAVGLPLEGIALVLSVDWLLDRFRTTVNVFGDAVGAAVVEKGFSA